MVPLTYEADLLLHRVAEFRAIGCRWHVVALRMEMTEAAVHELVASVPAERFARMVEFVKWDRATEREAQHLAGLRRAMRKAEEEGNAVASRRAAQALTTLVLREMAGWRRKKLLREKDRRMRARAAATAMRMAEKEAKKRERETKKKEKQEKRWRSKPSSPPGMVLQCSS